MRVLDSCWLHPRYSRASQDCAWHLPLSRDDGLVPIPPRYPRAEAVLAELRAAPCHTSLASGTAAELRHGGWAGRPVDFHLIVLDEHGRNVLDHTREPHFYPAEALVGAGRSAIRS